VKRLGVQGRPRALRAGGRTIGFADGSELEMDAGSWATGDQPDHCAVELPVTGEDGALRHRRGVTDVPGLFFLGLSWQHTRGSALLGFIADDAAFIARRTGAGREPARVTTDTGAPQEAGAAEGI